jgi:diacylglycerol kinase family enzyme
VRDVVVIVNRRARGLVRAGLLLRALKRRRDGVDVVETSSLAELGHIAREIARARPRVVVLAGGDGSYMAGVTALVETGIPLPAIALAPGGTVSTVARNWGLRGDRVRYTERLFESIAEETIATTTRPTLRVDDGRAARVGFICGAGLVARFFEVYESAGAPGYAGAAGIVARIFAGSFTGGALARRVLAPGACTVTVDGARAPFDRVSLVCASVVRDLGLHMHLLYRAGERSDRFHVVATPLDPRALGPQLPRVLSGRPLRGPRVDTLAATLSLRFPSGEGAYVLDGELFRSDAVDVTPGPILDVVRVARRR